MQNIDLNSRRDSDSSLFLIDTLQDLLKRGPFSCKKQKQALDICIDKKCQKDNPFICTDNECQCLKIHRNCIFKRIRQFTNVIEDKKEQIRQIEDVLNNQTDALIDKISDMRENLILKLRNNNSICSSSKNKGLFNSMRNFHSLQKCNGSLISELLDEIYSNQRQNFLKHNIETIKLESQKMHQKVNEYFIEIEKGFQTTQIPNKKFFKKIGVIGQTYWSQKLKGPNIVVDGPLLKRKQASKDCIVLLQPSIRQSKNLIYLVCDSIICWRMRVPKGVQPQWIGIGIGLKDKLTENKFEFVNFTNKVCNHGTYLLTCSGYSFTHQNLAQNRSLQYCFGYKENEVIHIELDLESLTLTFFNQTSKQQSIQYITFPYHNSTDSFHIIACIEGLEDQIEIISPIQTDRGEWTIQNKKSKETNI